MYEALEGADVLDYAYSCWKVVTALFSAAWAGQDDAFFKSWLQLSWGLYTADTVEGLKGLKIC